MRGMLLVVGVMLGSMGVAGCKGTPSCEEAINQAAKRVPELAAPKEMSRAVAACIENQWSAELRTCVAEARDQPDLVACRMRHESRTRKMFGDSKTDITKIKVKKYVFEAYPSWSAAHPDKACPDKLSDLNEYMSVSGTTLFETRIPCGSPSESARQGCQGPSAPSKGKLAGARRRRPLTAPADAWRMAARRGTGFLVSVETCDELRRG